MEYDLKNKNRPSLEPTDPAEDIPKQGWPIGPLQEMPLDEAEKAKKPSESAESETDKKPDQGTGQWPSVSWP